MTIVCDAPETGNAHVAHRIMASLYKLETTIDVDEVSTDAVARELCLIKIAAGPNSPQGLHSRSQVFELATVFRARIVDLAPDSIMLEITGSPSKIEGLLQVLRESEYSISKSPAPAAWRCVAATTPVAPTEPAPAICRHPRRKIPTPSPKTKPSPANSISLDLSALVPTSNPPKRRRL